MIAHRPTLPLALVSFFVAAAAPAADGQAPLDRHATAHAPPAIPAAEPDAAPRANSGFATSSAFTASGVTANAQTLSPPVTITDNSASDALAITETGTGKAVHANIKNPSSTSSALYGATNGLGAGLTGYNGGTGGPAGKFGVTNA